MSLDNDAAIWSAFEDDYEDADLDYEDDIDRALFPLPSSDSGFSASSPPSKPSPAATFYQKYTDSLRRNLSDDPPLHQRVLNTLVFMNAQGLNLELFLGALFWGDAECIRDSKIQHERTTFMRSPVLQDILALWWKSRTTERADGSDLMKEFVLTCTGEVLSAEMERATGSIFRPPQDNPLLEGNLTGLNFREVGESLQTSGGAPYLWRLLSMLSSTDRQRKENSVKNPFHVRLFLECRTLIFTVLFLRLFSQ